MTETDQERTENDDVALEAALEQENAKEPLTLDIKVDSKSACERHVTVTVSEADIQRYFSEQFDELMPNASVPGFRPGRAPRKLVESRFRNQISDQVKGSLLLDSMTQVNEEQSFSAISEPDFDFEAISIPDSGPLTYEFDIEVRPEFDLPDWKGLELEQISRDINDDDIDGQIRRLLSSQSTLDPKEGAVEAGDHVVVKIGVQKDGKALTSSDEITVPVVPKLVFPEATLESFDELVTGVKAGEEKTTQVTLSNDIENEELRGEELELTFSVLDVKQQNTPELTAEVLESYGVETEEKLREAVRSSLERQVEYQAGQKLRQQISSLLTGAADWDLPPDLLRRQFRRELERSILELRSSGFDESMIRAYENDLRQNTMANTRTSLQEHFILERIAEEEGIEDDPQDYDLEIAMIAMQQNDSPRRVRAHLERRGQMDALRNQIIERKVLERIKSEATFKEVEYELPNEASEGVEFSLVGAAKDSDIPEAKYSEDAPSTPGGSSKTS